MKQEQIVRLILEKGEPLSRFNYMENVILHSHQGWQYQHYGYKKRFAEYGIRQNMSRKENCLDNAMAENFFGIMKSELPYAEKFESSEDFIKNRIIY